MSVARIEDLVEDASSGFASGSNLENGEGVFQLRMNNVARDGSIDLSKKRRVEATQKQISRTKLVAGDVLFNATNSPDLVGKTMLFPGLDETVVFSNHFVRLRPTDDVLDGSYLARWLQREFERGFFRSKCKQWVNQATFGKDWLLKLQIPLPPIEEQRRIAAILDAADALRAKRRQALAKLDTLTQAIFIEMFGDLGEWDVLTLEELIELPLRNGVSPSKSGEVVAEVLTLSSITRGQFDSMARKESTFAVPHADDKTVDERDFLMCRGNGNRDLVGTGRFATASLPDVAFPDTIIAGRPAADRVSRAYLETVWASERVRKQIEAGARTTNGTFKVNQSLLRSIQVPSPPMSLQETFGAVVLQLELQRTDLANQQNSFDELFASLQQRAFRGDL